MKEINNLIANAIQKYFNKLFHLGYIKSKETDIMLLLLFIEELLNDDNYFITEEDYKIITTALNKLYGSSCIISFPSYNTYKVYLKELQFSNLRKSGNNLVRISETDIFRL